MLWWVISSTGSEQYDQVCGRIIGYQLGSPDAFDGPTLSILMELVSHMALPRQHIWSFVAGLDERRDFSQSTCPCVAESTNDNIIPSFVGQNYFCESGITEWNCQYVFFPNGDPLWDGQGCGPTSSCCTFNSPPWFTMSLKKIFVIGGWTIERKVICYQLEFGK